MGLGREPWAGDGSRDVPVPGQGDSAPRSWWAGVWRGGSKPGHELGRPQGVPKDVGVVIHRGHGTGQP